MDAVGALAGPSGAEAGADAGQDDERRCRATIEQRGDALQPLRTAVLGAHGDLEVDDDHPDHRECPGDVKPDDAPAHFDRPRPSGRLGPFAG